MAVLLKYLGHSFFYINFENDKLLIDPFISENSCQKEFKRLIKCPVSVKEIGKIDLILITHEHFDHFDKDNVEIIAKKNKARVIAPQNVINELNLPNHLKQPIEMNKIIKQNDLTIRAIPVHHSSSFYPLGYLISDGKFSIFHTGDTDLVESFRGLKSDVALLPIGGKLTMDISDCIRATKIIKPQYVIPMHYNTFKIIEASPEKFAEKIENSIIVTKPIILKPNQMIKF